VAYPEIESWQLVTGEGPRPLYRRSVAFQYRGRQVAASVDVDAERVAGPYGLQSILTHELDAALRPQRDAIDLELGPQDPADDDA
jgi:hypothetical protein